MSTLKLPIPKFAVLKLISPKVAVVFLASSAGGKEKFVIVSCKAPVTIKSNAPPLIIQYLLLMK